MHGGTGGAGFMAEQSPMVRDFELSSRDSDSTDTRRTVTKREPTGSSGRGNCLLLQRSPPSLPPFLPAKRTTRCAFATSSYFLQLPGLLREAMHNILCFSCSLHLSLRVSRRPVHCHAGKKLKLAGRSSGHNGGLRQK